MNCNIMHIKKNEKGNMKHVNYSNVHCHKTLFHTRDTYYRHTKDSLQIEFAYNVMHTCTSLLTQITFKGVNHNMKANLTRQLYIPDIVYSM